MIWSMVRKRNRASARRMERTRSVIQISRVVLAACEPSASFGRCRHMSMRRRFPRARRLRLPVLRL